MKVSRAAASLLLVATLGGCAAFDWKVCPGQQSKLQEAQSVELSPEPVPAGSTANFTIIGHSDIDVRSGHMALKVYYLGLPVYHKTLDLPGPIDKGHFVSSFTEDFPAITPPGHYKVQIESSAGDGTPLLCLLVEFQVTWSGSLRHAFW